MSKLVKILVMTSVLMAITSCSTTGGQKIMCELGSRTACIDYAR
nr:hypothetical protein [uncultured Leptotrichia sp.]